MSAQIRRVFNLICMGFLGFSLIACGGADKPFTLFEPTPPTTPSGSGSNPPPGGGGATGCFVNFNGTMQLKVSASPPNGTPLEKLDAKKVQLESIPLRVDGSNLVLMGEKFPDIILTTLSQSADLRLSGVDGSDGSGPYDSATGKVEINGFKIRLEILNKGTTTRFIDGEEVLSGVDFTTDSVTANGNLNPITEPGAPLNQSDRSIKLVIGLTLPGTFPELPVLNTMIGGGALTAAFEGTLDQLPQDCVEGGGTPGGGGSGSTAGPGEFSISDGSNANTGAIDFGSTPVIVTTAGGKMILDCKDAANRGVVTKTITLKNTTDGERKIKILKPADTDGDSKDPLCSGEGEFVRGSITVKGSASCESVTVGGKQFLTGDCKLPKDDASSISFPVMYVPFNYVAPAGGPAPAPAATPEATPDGSSAAQPVKDTGTLLFEYDDGKTFALKLSGQSEPDSRDSFSISKIKEGVESTNLIHNKGLIKLPLKTTDPKPFTQKLVLKNTGTDSWEEVKFTMGNATSAFSVPPPASATLAASNGTDPARLEFDLNFNPGSETSSNDTMTVTMVKVGSKSSSNPSGSVTTLTFSLLGTVGLPTLGGNVKFQVDFLAGKIDHSVTVDPVESLDFRAHPDQAPPALDLVFADTADDTIKSVTLNVENKDVMDKTKAERKTSLRILNAQATWGTPNRKLVPGEGSDLCNEPDNIAIPYENSRMECSYFYFNIFGDAPGVYNDDSGSLTLPQITLRIQNPYHSDIASKWQKSNPGGNPTNILDTDLDITLTTFLIDKKVIEDSGQELVMVPDERISASQLNVKGKPLGKECPDDFLNHDPGTGTLEEKHPHIKCYISSDEKYLQGREVALRPNQTTEYDVVLVGVSQYPTLTIDPNLPWFMGENGGSRMYVAIQGRLYLE